MIEARIIWISILGLAVLLLGILPVIERILGASWPREAYITILAIFIIVSLVQIGWSVFREIKSQATINDLERQTSSIQTFKMFVDIDAVTDSSTPGEKSTSAGLASAVAFFSKDDTRYRLVTDFQFSIQQIDANINKLSLVYELEQPNQILGKQLDFLESMDKFVCDYQQFFQDTGFNPGSAGNRIHMSIMINGVDVIDTEINADPGVLAGGKAVLDVSDAFKDITKKYRDRLADK